MSRTKLLSLIFLVCMPTFASFGQEVTKATAEMIYKMPNFPTDEFEVDSVTFSDGFKAYNVEHKLFAQSYYHLLYDIDGRLRLLLMACSECSPIYVWTIDYNDENRVKKISVVRNPTSKDYTVELEHYTFSDVAEWLKQQYLELPVIEELALDFVWEEGRLIKIGDVIIPENHIVEYGFLEGKKFWYRDIFGGDIYFLIHVYAENMSEEGAINRYYLENDLLLDCIYDENGKFVKAKAFDSDGKQKATYKNPNLDIKNVIEDIFK